MDRPLLARQIEELLAVHDVVDHVVVSPLTGSVLVFHPHGVSVHEVDRIVTQCIEQARVSIREQAPPPDHSPSRKPDSAPIDPLMDPVGASFSKSMAVATLTKLIDRALAHRRELWNFLATSSAKRLIEASPPIVIGIAVDVLLSPSTSLLARMGLTTALAPQLAIVATAGLTLWTLRSWLAYEERVSSTKLVEIMQHDLRSEAYAKLQSLDMSVFDSAKVGALSSIIDSDVQEIEGLLESGVKPFISLGAYGAVTAFSLALVSPGMLLIPAVCIPALLLLTISAIQPARDRFTVAHRLASDLNSLLIDNIDGIATIRAFGNEAMEAERVEAASQKLADATYDATRFVSKVTPALEGIVGIGLITSLTIGGLQMRRGVLNAGAYNALASSLLDLLSSVAYIGLSVARVQRYLTGLDRVFSLLERTPSVVDGDLPLPTASVHGHIRFENVNFAYREGELVLRNLSLEAPGGQTTAIVGGSGAGKTTLLKLLLRFYEPSGGHITLDGHPIVDVRQRDLLGAIALVNQDTFLFHGTIRENISYGRPDASIEEVQYAASQAAAHDFISHMPDGYDTVVGHRGAKLSGGQRQRIALARALLLDAPILALDEATSAIDSETEEAIQRSLMTTARGRTRIVVAHRLATIRHANRIYVLHQGEVVEQGSHDELVALNGIYGNLWRIQIGEAAAEHRASN